MVDVVGEDVIVLDNRRGSPSFVAVVVVVVDVVVDDDDETARSPRRSRSVTRLLRIGNAYAKV